jgi:hypothetical protein
LIWGIRMKNNRYNIVLSEITLDRIVKYRQDLAAKTEEPGAYLAKVLANQGYSLDNIDSIPTEKFIELLLATKLPKIFAESAIIGDGSDWNTTELRLLGDINVTTKVTIFDDGAWGAGSKLKVHKQPFEGELLFTPGALLHGGAFKGENPDLVEVTKIENGKRVINQEAYNALVERRLLPLLVHANASSTKEKPALVVLPGIGCGAFAGSFKGSMGQHLDIAIEMLLEKHKTKLPNIANVHFDPFNECKNKPKDGKRIGGIKYRVSPSGGKVPQLSSPSAFGMSPLKCTFFKIVAWDHVSLPGNDYFIGSRTTDDGAVGAATNVMEVITGVKGGYSKGKYIQPKEYVNWEAVAKGNGVHLNTEGRVIIAQESGAYVNLNEYSPTAHTTQTTPIMPAQAAKILNEADLKPTNAKTPGKSPSYQAELQQASADVGAKGTKFQVKKPGMFVRMRRYLGYDRDISDILGEFIASAISGAALNTGDVERAPEVYLVKGEDGYPVKIASRYINYGKEGIASTEIDNVLGQVEGKVKTKGKHATIKINGDEAEKAGELVPDKGYSSKDKSKSDTVIVKKELYRALKLSVLLGDHDLNLGNFFHIKNEKTDQNYVGRIDLGHAFNNLVKTWGPGADSRPRIAPDRGFVLDSLNRTEMNGLTETSLKFKRNFKGVIPDIDFADVLRESFDMARIQASIESAEEQILEMMKDPKCAKELTKALITLGVKIRAPINPEIIANMKRGDEAARVALVNECLANISSFVKKNQEEQVSLGNVIEVQALIDKALTGKEVNLSQIADRITHLYNTDKGYLSGKDKEIDEVEWLRTDKDKSIFKGSLRDYITHRATQLGIKPDKSLTNALLVGEQVLKNESQQYGVDILRNIITAQVVNSSIRSTPNTDELKIINRLVYLVRFTIWDDKVTFTPEQLKTIAKIAVTDFKKASKDSGEQFKIDTYSISQLPYGEIRKIDDFNSVWKTIKSAFVVKPEDHVKLLRHYEILKENHNKAHPNNQLSSAEHQALIKSFINSFRKTQGGQQKMPRDMLFSNEFVTAINRHVNDRENSAKLLAGLKGDKPFNPAELCKTYVTCMKNVQEIRVSFPEIGRSNNHIDIFIKDVSKSLSGKPLSSQALDKLRDKMIPGSPFITSHDAQKKMTDKQFAKNLGEHFPVLKNILEKVVIDLNQEKYSHSKDKQKYLDHEVQKMVRVISAKLHEEGINAHHKFSLLEIDAVAAVKFKEEGEERAELSDKLKAALTPMVPKKHAPIDFVKVTAQAYDEENFLRYIKANCPKLFKKIDKELMGIKDPLKYSEYVVAACKNIMQIPVVGEDDGLMQIENIMKLSDELGVMLGAQFDSPVFLFQEGKLIFNPEFVNSAFNYNVPLVEAMREKYPNIIEAISHEHGDELVYIDSAGEQQYDYGKYVEHINIIKGKIMNVCEADKSAFRAAENALPLDDDGRPSITIDEAFKKCEPQLRKIEEMLQNAGTINR